MDVLSLASLPSKVGPASHFHGTVHVASILQTGEPTTLSVRSLTFDRSARTHWHSNPLGQLLIITRGSGLVQQRGQSVQQVGDGDVVWAPPDVDHWHGGMEGESTHIEVHNRATVQWNGAGDDVVHNKQPLPHQSTTTAASIDHTTLRVIHTASLPTTSEHNAHFTGTVHLTPLLTALSPANTVVMSVTFECCARSDWHSHPLGQLLLVTDGSGRIQQRGQRVRRLTPGDVVWTPTNIEHWHGAGKVSTMTHVAVVWSRNGQFVEWKEAVSDADYSVEPESESGTGAGTVKMHGGLPAGVDWTDGMVGDCEISHRATCALSSGTLWK